MIGALNAVRSGRTSVVLLMLAALAGCGSGSDDSSQTASTAPVGGKVTGLNGSITISNNGGDFLLLNTDTAYRFAREVTRGGSYQVAVDNKPADQLCTVSNATGVVSGEVRNVDISCITPPQYSVGGTVTGLVGALKLRNNGGDEITLTADGAYTFPSTVMSTTGYQVTVYDEEANQDCTVSNGTGTISGAVTNVNVSCTTDAWVHPANLTVNISPDGQNARNSQVVMDNFGNAIEVWQQSDGSNTRIYRREYRLGSWGAATTVSTAGQNATIPRVAMGRNGAADDAVIVWLQNNAIYMSDYRGGSWNAPAIISFGATAADDPVVAMDDNGRAIIVWRQLDGPSSPEPFWQLFRSDYGITVAGWTHPGSLADNISEDGNHVYFLPDVAMDNNNEAVIVWRQYSGFGGGKFMVYRQELRGVTWSGEPVANSDYIGPIIAGNISAPKVAMDNNGNTIIVWEQSVAEAQPHPYYPGTDPVEIFHIYKSEYRSSIWNDPATASDHISPSGLNATSPAVAMDDNGNAIITWVQSDGNDLQLFKSEYRLSAWTHPFSLTDNISPDNESVDNATVAMDNNGDAIIAWRQFDGTRYMTYKSEYRSNTWRHPVSLLDAINPGSSSAVETGPNVAMDNTGDALILWSQSDAEDATGVQQIFQSELR